MDEVFSGLQEGLRPLENFPINRFHPSYFRFSAPNPKTPSSFFQKIGKINQ
jgi:hypothetical protein